MKIYYTPMDDCDICGRGEDDKPRNNPEADYLPVIQLRRDDKQTVIINLCWDCLGPVVEELCENPPY